MKGLQPEKAFYPEMIIAKDSLRFVLLAFCFVAMQLTFNPPVTAASPKSPQALSVPADSPRWDLEGQAKPVEYQGRKSLFLDGGAAVLKDLEMRDGIVDVDVATSATRGFFGIQFQIVDDGATAEGSTSASTRAGIRTPCSTRRSRAW